MQSRSGTVIVCSPARIASIESAWNAFMQYPRRTPRPGWSGCVKSMAHGALALESDPLVDQQHRNAVLDRVDARLVVAHQARFERRGHGLAADVLHAARGDAG